ncbi:N-alpha-acetyltransferase 40 [Cimex lectularius]|uniref:N-alpha-acetyltransferase 40 n=1 Tax=Cimex lectularius TaxID=79782 RepID=A0A8I6TJU8_CIMLE|nr:N-alpha-acetyltransferase 40 [Cimex lectularius]
MGRQTEKSKLKQAKIKEERKKLNLASALVRKANEIIDPLEDFPSFISFKNEDVDVVLDCRRVKDLTEDEFEKVVDLMRLNMKDYYEKCDWGWDEEKKREEMLESPARYLLARDRFDTTRILAFSHFRFDLDYKQSVLYLYELQLDPAVHRKKLGQFMLKALELMAFKNSMQKVILTVLKHNHTALAFFSKHGYTLDETNPVDNYEEQFCYYIFSKSKSFKENVVLQ